MSGRSAKRARKQVYDGADFRHRTYHVDTSEKGRIVGKYTKVEGGIRLLHPTIRADTFRQAYQAAKKLRA